MTTNKQVADYALQIAVLDALISDAGSQPRITVWLREERVGGGSASLGLDELELVEEKRTQC